MGGEGAPIASCGGGYSYTHGNEEVTISQLGMHHP